MNTLEKFSLRGKTAVVTGADGLIGRSHCQTLVDAGATVVAADIKAVDCDPMDSRWANGSFAHVVDVTDSDSVGCLLETVNERIGGVDILVNNAAINDSIENSGDRVENSRFENYPLETWKKSLDVNVTGVFICSQIIGAQMARAGSGSIINIASTYGLVAPDQSLYLDEDGQQTFFKSPVYPTTKGAVISFTRFLACYWAKAGVRVNTLTPGGVENGQDKIFIDRYSERTPLGRMAAPDDYQGALVFLASEASLYMTGANLVVDGGFTIW